MMCSRRRESIPILVTIAIIAVVVVAGMIPVGAQASGVVVDAQVESNPEVFGFWGSILRALVPSYHFSYHVECVSSYIGLAESQYRRCGSYGCQIIDYMGSVSFSYRFDGPTQDWLDDLGSFDVYKPYGLSVLLTDLLVFENATPGSGQCFPPVDNYYGRITVDGYFLDPNGEEAYFEDGNWYYITTLAFATLAPQRPINPPQFTISYGDSTECIVEGDATVSAWDYRKKIDVTPAVFPGNAKEFYIVYNETIYYDEDKNGVIDLSRFSVWLERTSGERGLLCDSTIYATGWMGQVMQPMHPPEWQPY